MRVIKYSLTAQCVFLDNENRNFLSYLVSLLLASLLGDRNWVLMQCPVSNWLKSVPKYLTTYLALEYG